MTTISFGDVAVGEVDETPGVTIVKPCANKYTLLELITQGNFGKIYKGKNNKNGELVAIKTESPEATLKHETRVLNYLYSKGCRNIPAVYWYGIYQNIHCLVIPLYDISLYDHRKQKPIDEENIKKIMIKMIEIFNDIHDYFVIHRDIKPQNILFYDNDIFLIDFGLSTFYINENGGHMENVLKNCIVGTSKYISHHIHDGQTAARRDDLISLGYIYMYLMKGSLPWENIHSMLDKSYPELHIFNRANLQRKEMKQNIHGYCQDYQQYFKDYMKYCYELEFSREPNYKYLKGLFMRI